MTMWTGGALEPMLAGGWSALNGFARVAAPLAVAALWQGAALACGLALCLRLAPRTQAAHRFAVWAAGFVALAALPALPLLLPERAAAGALAASGAHAWLELDARWSLAIAGLWLAASAARALDLGVHSLRLRRLWKAAAPVERERLAQALPPGRLRAWLPTEVCTTRALDRPSVIGFLAPRILIPEWLFERLTPGELEQVILHEAEHLRRGDDWTNLLQKLCLIVFPLNPGLAWMERRLCREREMACDDGVVRITQAPRAYAACLTSLAERSRARVLERRTEALTLGAWRQRPELVDRVHRLLRRTPGLSPLATGALLAALGGGLALGSIELARCPQLVAFVARPGMIHAEVASAATAAPSLAETRRETQTGVHESWQKNSRKAPDSALAEQGSLSPTEAAMATAGGTDVLLGGNHAAPADAQWIVLSGWAAPAPANAGGDAEMLGDVVLQPYDRDSNFTSKPAAPAVPAPGSVWLVIQL